MPNLLLTNSCNRKCVYCFAQDSNASLESIEYLSFEDLSYVVRLLERAGRRDINLLGGEPTLHPEFALFLKYLLAKNFRLIVFSNGMAGDRKIDQIEETIKDSVTGSVSFCINLNEPKYWGKGEEKLQDNFFRRLGNYCSLSFNIFENTWDPQFLIDTILKYSLKRSIRLGLASPIGDSRSNAYANTAAFRSIADLVLTLSELGAPHGIATNFDCGFPLCAFTDEQIGKLYKNAAHMQFVCDVPLDIGTNLDTWNCYPLGQFHKRNLREFEALADVYAFYRNAFADTRPLGIYPECRECRHKKNGSCHGGCMGHYVNQVSAVPLTRIG